MMTGNILLEDGTVIKGKHFGYEGTSLGELVFNTSMTGYEEILTDPSYAGQVVLMTYPTIGNYGINEEDRESSSSSVRGFIVKEFCVEPSNFRSKLSLEEYLKDNRIVGIYDVDTRMITKKIRKNGVMKCLITSEDISEEHAQMLSSYEFPKDIVKSVSVKEKTSIGGRYEKICLMDFGVKKSIVKTLKDLGCSIDIVPWNTKSSYILNGGYDAVFLSNGPGDPKDLVEVIGEVKKMIGKIPMFGVCLGHQLLALSLGGDTTKLKFGHRGANHPVINLKTNKVMMTSQNHGYAMTEECPKDLVITHLNVNDNTIEGFKSQKYKIKAVQFHPEAGPGPMDGKCIIKNWIDSIEKEEKYA